ncbi:protein FAM204A isoform X1 [Nothobranchius furzeri]|uniref:Family with sequence similarity 204 member A n=1 Tax=Nothobranchius furzeri TaxID=105023 RepID=A0A1A7ZNG8_NOTFU|nr:protein FAM204A isoform X1 [Nothobranchius furzeri]KAF7219832.1 family with sequence similarity 204 member A [Nothobranchius furzeri]
MYSGLLPKDLTEDDLSSDAELEDGVVKGDDEEKEFGEHSTNTMPVVDARSPHFGADDDSPTCKMPGVSQGAWQKFQELRKKKDEIKAMEVPQKRRRRRKRGRKCEEPADTGEHHDDPDERWDELKQYFGVNDRFLPPASSTPPLKSGLEKSIEQAIAEGDIAHAEEMSDRLATREMAVKIAQAADCRDFVQQKQEEEAKRTALKRRKQLAWGFEMKKRWETKSNMGYM